MSSRYETVFILTPVLSEEQAKEAVAKYRDLIKSNGGEIKHEENWGLRKLAYPIQKKTTGFYHLLEFEVPGEFIGNMELEFRRDERVLRFLTVRLDKYGVQYVESRRTKKSTVEN
ncbi:MAG: 30S ribosomal protein S6 [Luteibaculum sp.]